MNRKSTRQEGGGTEQMKKIVRLVSVIVALVGGGVGYDLMTPDTPAEPTREEASVERPPATAEKTPKPSSVRIEPSVPSSVRKRCVFASFRDGQWVTGWGRVKKLLPDDTVPPCHQRFLLVDETGETLLVANNIDRWPRLYDLHQGDVVEFKGEFKDTERGYLVHWTHPDTSGRRPGGYVRKGQ